MLVASPVQLRALSRWLSDIGLTVTGAGQLAVRSPVCLGAWVPCQGRGGGVCGFGCLCAWLPARVPGYDPVLVE